MSQKKQVTFEECMENVKTYIKRPENIELIQKAYDFAYEHHKGQFRKSGEPYVIHVIQVANTLAEIHCGPKTIAAGLLHDTVEDCEGVTTETITELFGEEIATLVDAVTKIGAIKFKDEEEYLASNHRKLFIAMAKDIRVILIKLADRLHNMRTLQYMRPEKQKKIARETLSVYAPIAHRLGISEIKNELEDLSFKYLDYKKYEEIKDLVKQRESDRNEQVQEMISDIEAILKEYNIQYRIFGRSKHFYSIYKKMVTKNKRFEEILDLLAIRIITDSVVHCYEILGYIHAKYRPIPGRFKDYIAMPKPNMYQSLHTTLIGPNGTPFEIQIRTFEMHRTAEYGIAAHWKYKEQSDGKKASGNQEEAKMTWLRQILEWQRDMSDNREFMNLLKSDLDLFAENVYCFTPAGDVKNLPAGSTPIDFAYSVHSAVGNKMVGARVNGKLVNIDYVIQNGDRVEVITSQNSQGPSRDWLKIVKSTQAKNKINQWFKQELKEDNIIKGQNLFSNYCKAKGIVQSDLLKPEFMQTVMAKYGFRDWDSVMAAIGHGGLKEGQVGNRLLEEYKKKQKKDMTDAQVLQAVESAGISVSSQGKDKTRKTHNKSGIVVKGIDDVAVRFAKCCSPVPGDEIVGFVTRGRGVTIHRTDCVNMIHLPGEDRVRLIDAEWQSAGDVSGRYPAEIKIFGNNRTGLLVDISKIFTERQIDMTGVNSRTSKQGTATISLSFEVGSRSELDSLIARLRQVESVLDIERTTG